MKNLPSFMSSTLSIAFVVCVIASVVMVFLQIEPNDVTFGIVSAVVWAYLSARNPNYTPKEKTLSNDLLDELWSIVTD